MSKSYLVAAVALAAVFPSALFAASTDQQALLLPEMVVTAGRLAEDKATVSSNVAVIAREEIEQATATTVADLLVEKGISQIRKYPGTLSSVGLRGFRTDTHGNDLQGHVLILLDGRRAGTGNAAKLLTENIERIEIIRGPAAVQYGSAGMGGVVNIITRQGTKNAAYVEAGAGSWGQVETNAGLTAREGKIDFAGTVNLQTSDDYDTGSGDTFANTATDQQAGFSFNGGYQIAANQRLGLTVTGSDVQDTGNPGYFSKNDLDDSNDKSNISADLSYTGSADAGRTNWLARYFLGRDENTWKWPTASNPDGYDDNINSGNTTNQMGAQLQGSRKLGMVTLTAGLDWLAYEVENTWTPEKTEYQNPALFLLAKTSLFDPSLTLNAGLRQDWFTVEVTEPSGREEDESNLTPQLGLAWQASKAWKLRLQYAQGFTVPSADQLAADFVNWGARTVGNPELDPEKSDSYEAGADYAAGGLTASFTYFHTDFSDKIVTDYRADGARSWKNLGDATISGLETEVSYDLGAPLGLSWEIRPYLNLTLLDTYEDEATGEDLQYVSDLSGAAGIALDNGKGLSMRVNFTHTSSQYIQDYESGIYPVPVVELDSVTLANLSASWKFWQDERYGALTVRGEVQNITDEEYAYVKGYPMPGRTFLVKLRWDY